MKRSACVLLMVFCALLPLFANGEQQVKDSGKGVTLEAVAWGSGGYEKWFQAVADEMKLKYPDIQFKVWSTTRGEELQPRMIAGDPPDVQGGSGAKMVEDGLLAPLNDLLDGPAYDAKSSLRDTFLAGALDDMTFDGTTYYLPREPGMQGLWYDEVLFKKQGWTVPKTWEGLLALFEKIKADGYVPFTYQGMYPGYLEAIVTPLIYKVAGEQAWKDINNLVPGAWKNPDVMRALKLLQDLVTGPGNVLKGTEGLNHTASQMEWLNHKAVFIPCGTWLPDEMKDVTPPGFQMRVMMIPGPAKSKGDANAIETYVWGGYCVPKDAKNAAWAKEFLRIMYSKKMAQKFAEITGMFLSIKGGTDGVELPPSVRDAYDLMSKTRTIITFKAVNSWYPSLAKVYNDNIAEFAWGRITVEKYTDLLEAQAKKVAADETITKFKVK